MEMGIKDMEGDGVTKRYEPRGIPFERKVKRYRGQNQALEYAQKPEKKSSKTATDMEVQ